MAATPKQRLLNAVVQVALDDGIADKSLRAIAEASGTSHRMLIHHFGSKENLFVEVIREVEAQQRAIYHKFYGDPNATSEEQAMRFWKHLRSSKLAPQERLFFEVYSQALQGRVWAQPLLDGIVDDWVEPVAAQLEAHGVERNLARTVARLSVAVGRGLLLDVLATGNARAVDRAMQLFAQMLPVFLATAEDTHPVSRRGSS